MRFPVLMLIFLAAGCQRPTAAVSSAATGPKSPTGWEIRYNATLALANRGSPHVTDPEVWDSLLEMLDEHQQLRNFRTRSDNGQETLDETGAYTTVISALQAVQEFHRRQPTMDFSGLKGPIEKLTHSRNATVGVQAKQALLTLFPP
jgi:hypothetical protein